VKFLYEIPHRSHGFAIYIFVTMYSVPFQWEPSDNDRNGTVLDTSINGYPTSGRHASLMATSRSGGGGVLGQNPGGDNNLREGLLMSGTLTGQKVNYLDSGYSEEDPSEQANVYTVMCSFLSF
jgi:hypothetical protein